MTIPHTIAGLNGAGKTTSVGKLLSGVLNCVEFVNAYLIANGVSPYTKSIAIQAGRIMLKIMTYARGLLLNSNTDVTCNVPDQ